MNWAEKTPAFVPKMRKWSSSDMQFSFRNVLKREYNGFFAVFISLTLVNLIRNFKDYNSFELTHLIDSWWLWLTPLAFVVFITLRTLKKTTKVLNVEGR